MNRTLPSISVIMSIFNEEEEWLHQSIESILNQTFSDFEFIIINDNPARGVNKTILNQFKAKDSRIIVIENKENIGLTRSLNIGIETAKGKYIARMDADDISLPTRFEKQFDYMESHPDCVVCGTKIKYINKKFKHLYIKVYVNDDDLKAQLLYRNCFSHPTVFIRKSVLDEHNLNYNPQFKQSQDYYMWKELKYLGTFHNINEYLLSYRISKTQISTQKRDGQAKLANKVIFEQATDLLKNINIEIPQTITLSFIKEIKKHQQSFNPKEYKALLQIFYLSIKTHKIKALLYCFFAGDIFKMSFMYKIKFMLSAFNIKPFYYL